MAFGSSPFAVHRSAFGVRRRREVLQRKIFKNPSCRRTRADIWIRVKIVSSHSGPGCNKLTGSHRTSL